MGNQDLTGQQINAAILLIQQNPPMHSSFHPRQVKTRQCLLARAEPLGHPLKYQPRPLIPAEDPAPDEKRQHHSVTLPLIVKCLIRFNN